MSAAIAARRAARRAIGWLAPLAAITLACAALAQAPAYPPAEQEPLHVVRHRSDAFLIYTNHLKPGVWTRFHSHGNDLLALIAGDTTAAAQTPGGPVQTQRAPAGTAAFFPYADGAMPYVHRVGAMGQTPFLNVGLEFREAPGTPCANATVWEAPGATATKSTRRGTAYRLELPAGATRALPASGRALLLVALPSPDGPANVTVGDTSWTPTAGEFRFYDGTAGAARPPSVHNAGATPLSLSLFVAC